MILSGETAAKWIGCVAGRYRNSTQRLKQKKMRATSVTALAQKITLFKLYLFLWSYGCLLCNISVPYDYYTTLSSFVTDELTGFHIFCKFPVAHLLHSDNRLLLDISILPDSFYSSLTWKYPQSIQSFVFSLSTLGVAYQNTLRLLFCNKARLIERVDSNSIDPPNSPAGKKAPAGLF